MATGVLGSHHKDFITQLIDWDWFTCSVLDQSLAIREWWTQVLIWGHMDIEESTTRSISACLILMDHATFWGFLMFLLWRALHFYTLSWLYLVDWFPTCCHCKLLFPVSVSARSLLYSHSSFDYLVICFLAIVSWENEKKNHLTRDFYTD